MILRARVKAAEDLIGVCCEKMRATLLAFDREIRVSSGARLKKTNCQFCRAPFLGMRIFGMRGWRINPKWWEIDEGTIHGENAEAVAGGSAGADSERD